MHPSANGSTSHPVVQIQTQSLLDLSFSHPHHQQVLLALSAKECQNLTHSHLHGHYPSLSNIIFPLDYATGPFWVSWFPFLLLEPFSLTVEQ